MSFHLSSFYEQLDKSYAALNRNATEDFLLDSREKARVSCEPMILRDGCPACAPRLEPNKGLIAVCNELACFYRGLSRWEESLEAFSEAQQELERFYQTDTVQYATILLNKAGTYRYMGQPRQALELFGQSEQILSRHQQTPDGVMAGLYNNTGLSLLDLGRPEEALARFRQALERIGSHPDFVVEQGSTWNNIASAYSSLGKPLEAVSAMDRSISILENLDCGKNPHYPAALNTRGILQYRQGNYTEAAADFSAALEITALIYGKNIEYAYGCDNCSLTCQKLGQTEQARAWKDEADAIRKRLGVQ